MRVLLLMLIFAGPVAQGLHIMKINDESLKTRTLDALYFSVEELRKTADGDPIMEPCMTRDERKLFYELLESATTYQEFGTGGSTVVAVHHENIRLQNKLLFFTTQRPKAVKPFSFATKAPGPTRRTRA